MENDERRQSTRTEETCLPRHVSSEDTTAHASTALPERAVGAWHLVAFGADWRRARALVVDGPVTLGRATGVALLAGDSSASRQHVRLTPRGEHLEVEDLGSRNGTFVDGRRVLHATAAAGSLLRAGDTLLRVVRLGESFEAATPEGPFVGGSAVAGLRRMIALVGPTPLPVLILGETGTGKEVVARLIHAASRRRGAFIAVNCAALPATLLESELFGHVRGAFTGAGGARKGLFAAAADGTLFLDEIGELPLPAQAALLRVLEDGMVRPIGSEVARKVDVRVLAATNRDLHRAAAEKTFRADLLARLAGVEAVIPPLRSHPEDLPALIAFLCARAGLAPLAFSADALESLALHPWPHNLRELDHLVRQLALRPRGTVQLADLPPTMRPALATAPAARSGFRFVDDDRRSAIEEALVIHRGNVRQASRALGVARSHVYRLLKRWNLDPTRFRGTPIADESDPQ